MRVWQRKCVRRLPAILAAVAAWVLTGCGTMSDEPRSGEGAPMSSVRVAFTDGFEGDTVVIRVDGREVTQHGPITTRSDVSPPLAWSADIPLERDVVALEVAVPTKGATGSIRVNVKEFPQVNVSFSGGRVELRSSRLIPSIG
jgi:hypothetical protein